MFVVQNVLEDEMKYMQFRYVSIGRLFVVEGQEYIKTSFNRGYFFADGKKIFRTFKKRRLVLADDKISDIDD